MPGPVVVAAVGLAAAGFFSVFGRQFRAYGTGQRSYVALLEGRWWLAAILIAVLSVASSGLLAFLTDGSATTFWVFLGGFAALSVAIITWVLARAKR